MNQDIQSKTIIISGVEKKNSSNNKVMIKFKDEKNLTYTMWPQKQDGTESSAYSFYKVMDLDGIGRAVEISYTEQQGDFQGKPVTYRTIIGMKASHAGTSEVVAKKMIGADVQDKEQEKWDRLAWGKCKTLFLVEGWKESMGSLLDKYEPLAEQWADACMRKLEPKTDTAKIEEYFNTPNIPTINIDEEPPMLSEPPF
jgi:hypothetical protein